MTLKSKKLGWCNYGDRFWITENGNHGRVSVSSFENKSEALEYLEYHSEYCKERSESLLKESADIDAFIKALKSGLIEEDVSFIERCASRQ